MEITTMKAITIKELREAIDTLPDDHVVYLSISEWRDWALQKLKIAAKEWGEINGPGAKLEMERREQ
jgi:hypothetical protein